MIKLNLINNVSDDNFKTLLMPVAKQASLDLEIKEKRILNVVICDNEFIKGYNERYRHVDKETDVLSFPSDEDGELGDILISLDKAREQAIEYGHSLDRELAFLMLHGILHCLGFDHQTKEEEDVMFPLQEKILDECNLRRN